MACGKACMPERGVYANGRAGGANPAPKEWNRRVHASSLHAFRNLPDLSVARSSHPSLVARPQKFPTGVLLRTTRTPLSTRRCCLRFSTWTTQMFAGSPCSSTCTLSYLRSTTASEFVRYAWFLYTPTTLSTRSFRACTTKFLYSCPSAARGTVSRAETDVTDA